MLRQLVGTIVQHFAAARDKTALVLTGIIRISMLRKSSSKAAFFPRLWITLTLFFFASTVSLIFVRASRLNQGKMLVIIGVIVREYNAGEKERKNLIKIFSPRTIGFRLNDYRDY